MNVNVNHALDIRITIDLRVLFLEFALFRFKFVVQTEYLKIVHGC